MKFRTDFVTNSSSSSFLLCIEIELRNQKTLTFSAMGGSPETGRINYFDDDAVVTVSPKQLGTSKTVDEMIEKLTEGVCDQNQWDDEYPARQIFAKSEPMEADACLPDEDGNWKGLGSFDAYDFIKAIRENVVSMDDIVSIMISGDEENYVSYRQRYTYNRDTGEYTGFVHGEEFEKDGVDGGTIAMPDIDECDIVYEEAEWNR